MKKTLLRFLLVIILIMSLGYGCLKYRYERQEIPCIVFIQENYYSGENGYGTFVDKEGNIYKFDLTGTKAMSDKKKYQYLEDTYLRSSVKGSIVGKVEPKKLKEYYSFIKKASASKRKLIIRESNLDVYLGYRNWNAYRYSILGKLQVITLCGTGDWKIVSRDRNVKKIVGSVKKILPGPAE